MADDDSLYFGPCLPSAEEAAYRDRLGECAAEIAGKMTRDEVGPGLPPGYRFEFSGGERKLLPWSTETVDWQDEAWEFARQVRGAAPEPPPDGFTLPPGFAEDFRDAVMDAFGLPRDLSTHPLPPPTWRTRLRSRWNELRERTARRAFKIIAGYDVPEQEDW